MTSKPVTKTSSKVRVRAAWQGLHELPIAPVNQFIASVGIAGEVPEPDGVNLVLGYLAPPVFLGTPEEVREQAAALTELPIEIKGRFLLTRARLDELIKVLQSAAAQYDQMTGEDRE